MKLKILLFLLAGPVTLNLFSQGYYIEYKTTMSQQNITGSSKIYSMDGNTRMETLTKVNGQSIDMAMLTLKTDPDKVYQLNLDKKTYTVIDAGPKKNSNPNTKDYDPNDYIITVEGKEQVDGYNTTHVLIKNSKDNNTWEWWVSTDVPGYSDFNNIKSQNSKPNLMKALAAKGVLGFPVRTKMEVRKGNVVQMDLVKASKMSVDAALFSLSGYTKGAELNPAAMQNMTPEEKQQYIQQYMQQNQH